MTDAIPGLLPEYPQYWIARPCWHWDAARNRRFRLYRLDGPVDHCGRYPGFVWDAERREWLDQCRFGGIAGYELARRATGDEIAATRKEAA